jgi:hypothetical protein
MKYLFLVVVLFIPTTWADCGHGNNPCEVSIPGPPGPQGEQGPPGPQGVAGVNGTDGDSGAGVNTFSSETLSSYSTEDYSNGLMAGSMAISQLDFSSSTRHWQIGIGVGGYEGEQAIAFGAGKLITKYDMLFKASATYVNSEPAYGAGLMWKIQ